MGVLSVHLNQPNIARRWYYCINSKCQFYKSSQLAVSFVIYITQSGYLFALKPSQGHRKRREKIKDTKSFEEKAAGLSLPHSFL